MVPKEDRIFFTDCRHIFNPFEHMCRVDLIRYQALWNNFRCAFGNEKWKMGDRLSRFYSIIIHLIIQRFIDMQNLPKKYLIRNW